MLRMMMWDPVDHDAAFKAMTTMTMQPLQPRQQHRGFQRDSGTPHDAALMNQTGDGKMDWFFNEFVYGTYLPDYKLESRFHPNDEWVHHEPDDHPPNVDDKFMMAVLVWHLGFRKREGCENRLGARGRQIRLSPLTVPLTNISETPKTRFLLYYESRHPLYGEWAVKCHPNSPQPLPVSRIEATRFPETHYDSFSGS